MIAAGFDRWDSSRTEATPAARPKLAAVDTPAPAKDPFASADDELDIGGDDDFDVPSFLK